MLFSNNDILQYGDTVVATEGYGVETAGHIRAMHEFGMDLLEIRKFETQCESAALEAYVAAGSGVTMESFEGELQIMREGFLSEWKDKIVAALKKAWAKIKGWFKSLKNWIKDKLTSDKKWFDENSALISANKSKSIKVDAYKYDLSLKLTGIDKISDEEYAKVPEQSEIEKEMLSKFGVTKNGTVAESVKEHMCGVKQIYEAKVSYLVSLKDAADKALKNIDILERDTDNAYNLLIKTVEKVKEDEKKEKAKEAIQRKITVFRMKQSIANTIIKAYSAVLVEVSKFAVVNTRKAVKSGDK